MKKLLLVLPLIFIGCSSVHYTEIATDGTKKEFKYSRVGKQELNGFSYDSLADGSKSVELESNKAEAGQLVELFNNLVELAQKAAK